MSVIGKEPLPDEDEALERLVLHAALMDTNNDRLERQVLARVNADRGSAFVSLVSGILLRPATMTACAVLLSVALAVGGYWTAGSQANPTDARLLALAAGAPIGGGLLDLSIDNDTENAL